MRVISTRLGNDPDPYYVVGTALLCNEEPEPTLGRILVLQYNDGKCQRSPNHSPYQMPSPIGRLTDEQKPIIKAAVDILTTVVKVTHFEDSIAP